MNQNSTIVEKFENDLYVSHRVIAEKTDNKILSVQKLITENITVLEEFGKLRFEIEAIINSKNRTNQEKTYFLNEQQTTLILTFMRNNEIVKNFKIRLVKDFFEMRKQLQNREPQKDSFQQKKEKFQLDVLGLESSFKLLRINEASKILMTKTLYTEHGLSTSYLPKYSDENHTYSLSHLLKKFEVGISAKKLNLILLKEGYLEIKTRKSSGSLFDEETKEKTPKMKEFKSLTEKGLKFGKNIISQHNQLETQPHYYEKSFMELIESLKI